MDRISQIQSRIKEIESQFNPQARQEGPSFQQMLSQAQGSMRIDMGGPQTNYGQFMTQGAAAVPGAPTVTSGGRVISGFVNPCPSGTLSPYNGDDGLDIHAPRGTPVMAAKDGVVVYNDPRGHTGDWEGPGNDTGAIRIRHADGTESWYAHLSDRDGNLKPGMTVKAGQVIGKSGVANNVPHLHMSIFYSSGGDAGGFMDPFEMAKMYEKGGTGNYASTQGQLPQTPAMMPPYNPMFGMNPMVPGLNQGSGFNQMGNSFSNMNNIMNMNMSADLKALDQDSEDKDSAN
jgi:murein DD-endopeptidase MepM/ murein hydrolase activator NlpD